MLRAYPTMPQTSALNYNIGLYAGKTISIMPYFLKLVKKKL
jgi:hypothetical protein